MQVLPNLILPWNRLAVLAFVLLVLCFTWPTLNRTCLGMNVRAVTQNRAMAACCGVPTGRVDMLAFGLGSGIAGLGGVVLSQLGNVGPELGQGYIIDSFLVVVLGGVGQLAGSVAAAFGLGIFNKILEPQMGAVLGKILILVMIILFIQKRPQGLFALKKGGLLTNEPTNHLNAGAARAAASALAGDPAGAGAAVYAIPGAAAGLASAGGAELAADAERQNPLLRHCGGGAGSGLGLRGYAVAGARDFLCPRRVRHGDVPDAPGGGGRSTGVYVFSLLERAALVLVGHAAFRLGDGAGGAGSRSAGPGFRLVCLSLKIKGVYFSIMTQALTYAGMLLFFRNETGFGGNNGFTGFTTLLGFPVTATGTRASLFMATVLLLLLTLWLGAALAQSKFGRILTAVRDAENRLMFCGYDPRGFKLLVWTLSAVLCGLAGALYVPQVGIINPSEMSPTNSIEAAIWVALGGRGTLIGPVLGAGSVNGAKSIFTVAMPEYWQLFLGLIFIIVTLFLPRGVMGLLRRGDRERNRMKDYLPASCPAIAFANKPIRAAAGEHQRQL